jgi:hypothetical protein
LTIASDLVVWKGGLPEPEEDGEAKQQQRMFLGCNVNVEIKRFELMKDTKNRTPLTQVAAESLARRKSLVATRGPKFILYSILTDISGLYVLWHGINNDNEPVDMYWVSRQETDPERFLAIIYWLCLCSMGKSTAIFDPLWKQETYTATNDESRRSKQTGAEEEECEDMVKISFDDSDEEREAEKWDTFYAIETHRILGTSLPLTTDLLELHNTDSRRW